MLWVGIVLIGLFMVFPAMSQPRYGNAPGYGDEYGYNGPWMGRGWGHGMGPGGMMGYGSYAYVPPKLPVPKNKE